MDSEIIHSLFSLLDKSIAEKFGISDTKLYGALTFMGYPERLRKLVDTFPYSAIVRAKPVFEVAERFYGEVEQSSGTREFGYLGEDLLKSLEISGVDGLAAAEVETWLILRQAELLRRRTLAPAKSLQPAEYAEKLDSEMRTPTLLFEGVTRSLPDLPDVYENSPEARRYRAIGALVSAANDALSLAEKLQSNSPAVPARVVQ